MTQKREFRAETVVQQNNNNVVLASLPVLVGFPSQ